MSGAPTSARMKMTAGAIRAAASTRRLSNTSAPRLQIPLWATATTAGGATLTSRSKLRASSPMAEIRRRVTEASRVLGLDPVLKKKPRTLSGGQRQRVAMGRAIVREPQAFLMDEPLSNLDAKLRVEMRAEIARIQRDLNATTIYVTHDQTEAMTLGDRVAVMRDGVLQQAGEPKELYERPVNLFVAEFIGSPAMNLVGADIGRENGRLEAVFGENSLRLDAHPALAPFEGRRVILGVRPEDLEDAAVAGAEDGRTIASVVDIREDLGAEVLVHFGIAGPPVRGEDVQAA